MSTQNRGLTSNRDLYFFRFVKEQYSQLAKNQKKTQPLVSDFLAGSVVEVNGIEPMTSCLQSRRSPN
jgi:hypothetical protein